MFVPIIIVAAIAILWYFLGAEKDNVNVKSKDLYYRKGKAKQRSVFKTRYTGNYGTPMFIPKEHTKMSYCAQNRAAKRRRAAK